MPCLVLHDLATLSAEGERRFFEAIFQVAAEHWPVTEAATVVDTDVCPAYLRDHLRRTLSDCGAPDALLLVTRLADPAWHGLPAEGATWLRAALAG